MLLALSLILLLVLLMLTRRAWMPQLYTSLDVSQSPAHADVIVVLGGSANRGSYAATILEQVQPQRIILSGGNVEIERNQYQIIAAGFASHAIDIIYYADSTYDEAERVFDHLQQFNYQSVLIVTSPFHTRRALATYECLSRTRGERYNFRIAAYEGSVSAETWWHNTTMRNYISLEWIKTAFYIVRYGVICY